jgi:hypothetical protein
VQGISCSVHPPQDTGSDDHYEQCRIYLKHSVGVGGLLVMPVIHWPVFRPPKADGRRTHRA